MFRIELTIQQYEDIFDSWDCDINMGENYDQNEDDDNGFPLYNEAYEKVEKKSVEVIVYSHDYGVNF